MNRKLNLDWSDREARLAYKRDWQRKLRAQLPPGKKEHARKSMLAEMSVILGIRVRIRP